MNRGPPTSKQPPTNLTRDFTSTLLDFQFVWDESQVKGATTPAQFNAVACLIAAHTHARTNTHIHMQEMDRNKNVKMND